MAPLHDELQKLLEEVRKKRGFVPEQWIEAKCKMLNDYMLKAHIAGIVINMSGGIDSSTTAALCLHAMKLEGSPIKRVVGVAQPIHVCFASFPPLSFSYALEHKINSKPCRRSFKSHWT